MSFTNYLNEGFIGVQDVQSDSDILRLAIQAELDAANLYDILARKTHNEDLKKVLLHVKEEEHVHIGEFETLLEMIDPEYEESEEEGEDEVKELLDDSECPYEDED